MQDLFLQIHGLSFPCLLLCTNLFLVLLPCMKCVWLSSPTPVPHFSNGPSVTHARTGMWVKRKVVYSTETSTSYVGSILTSRCSGNEPALLSERVLSGRIEVRTRESGGNPAYLIRYVSYFKLFFFFFFRFSFPSSDFFTLFKTVNTALLDVCCIFLIFYSIFQSFRKIIMYVVYSTLIKSIRKLKRLHMFFLIR